MAKANILILCPSGHRRKAQMSPNTNLLQVLEEMCLQEKFESSEWGLIHQRKKCDLTIPWRLLGIPSNALLEMFKLDKPRAETNISIQLQIADNSRQIGSFLPSNNFEEILNWFRNQPDSALLNFDKSIPNVEELTPICSYMSEEIIGKNAASKTTLKELGLTGGSVVIRFNYRSVSQEEMKIIDERLEKKQNRRIQSAAQSNETPKILENLPMKIEIPQIPSNVTNFDLSNDEFSIFRDVPISTGEKKEKPKSLAETLGLRVSFDRPQFFQASLAEKQEDFSDFKFPEATKGVDLTQNESTGKISSSVEIKTLERFPLAYDRNKNSGKSSEQVEDLPDSFFELTADDLRSVLETLRQQSSEETPLESRSVRERARSARANQYDKIVIRFVVDSNLVLQGIFLPSEPVSSLVEFVRENLRCSQMNDSGFYLYTRPPKTVFSDLKKSLISYDLAPAAFVYLAHKKVSPLKIELTEKVRIGTIDEANDLATKHVFTRTEQSQSVPNDSTSNKRTASVNPIYEQQFKDKMKKFLAGKK